MDGNVISRARVAVAGLAVLCVLAPILVLSAGPVRTNDLWFHLAAGRAYAEQGPWPDADPLLHTAHDDAPVQHEWLFGVGVWALESTAGFSGLRIAPLLTVLATSGLAFACFRRAGVPTAGALAGTTAFLAISWWRLIQLRPDLVSIPATLLTWWLILSGPSRPGAGRIAAAAALALLWANMHSLFAIGPALIVAGILAVGLRAILARRLREGDVEDARALLMAAAAMLLAALLNPRGIGQHLTFLTSSREAGIWRIADEWTPFDPFTVPDMGPMLTPLAWLLCDLALAGSLVVASWHLLACWRDPSREQLERLDATYLGLAAAGSVAMLTSIRFAWMAIFPLLYLARATRGVRGNALAVPALACAVAAAFPAWGGALDRLRTLPQDPSTYFRWRFDPRPLQARSVRFLLDTELSGNAFNRYSHGGFLGYWLAPRVRTFVDGRTEHYPPEVLEDYFRIANQVEVRPGESALEALDRREVDLYLGIGLPVEGEPFYSTARLDGAPGWIQVSRSVDHSIFLRANERNRENLERVVAHYAAAGIPFDPERGFDPLLAARSRPDWAVEAGVVPPDYSRWLVARSSDDPAERALALERLATLLYLLGAYDAQIALDRESLLLRPEAIEPRRRIVMALLRLGRDAEAGVVVGEIAQITSNAPPTGDLARLLGEVEQLRIDPRVRAPGAAINALPVFTRPQLQRFFAAGPPRIAELPDSPGV